MHRILFCPYEDAVEVPDRPVQIRQNDEEGRFKMSPTMIIIVAVGIACWAYVIFSVGLRLIANSTSQKLKKTIEEALKNK
ncbi:MAG TPA: hypothetical protein PL048_07300 [Leptospiraceae bacterium]|nr:hypothetical protein [Leptospiraceae bacterium]HMY66390.1 hypothetical protein [Leptospiraceae bacterium]HMZ58565.1 hypothetical protein [Leptospiraceae bacterium]HNF13599.1 hypothetical protein [Leptospiraceae bacterium]HNF25260.1 hypothetical protein [Leptospiraceae bacterium]